MSNATPEPPREPRALPPSYNDYAQGVQGGDRAGRAADEDADPQPEGTEQQEAPRPNASAQPTSGTGPYGQSAGNAQFVQVPGPQAQPQRQAGQLPGLSGLSGYGQAPSAALAQVPKGTIKIGLWGSQESGKTTYLAALRHALGVSENNYGRWNVIPLTAASSNLMIELARALNRGDFPEATLPGSKTSLQWLFDGDITKSRFAGRGERMGRRLTGRGPLTSQFVLDLIDVSGVAFSDDPAKAGTHQDVADAALDHMLNAGGLIYLFDPLRERQHGDAYEYVNRTIAELKRKTYELTGHTGPLPQELSVCITKFDHVDVFQEARRNGLVYDGADGMPRVRDEHAEQFFEILCTGRFWSRRYETGDRSASLVMNELRSSFDHRKIRYFVTSSIGFWTPPRWQAESADFDPGDYSNYYRKGDRIGGIRGTIHPINVLEPLISLQQRIKGRA